MIIRPRLSDYYSIPLLQSEVDFAIPFMDEDIPLYVDPFLLWNSPSQMDNANHICILEAFTNSIIHSDFIMESGILRIEKHDDKLVFRNPGLLRLPIEQIYEGGVSFARNPKIQNMLRMVGYGENLGSGFPLILEAWKQAGWEKPELKNKVELDEVELMMPLPLPNVVKDVVKELPERQRFVLEIIKLDPYISAKAIAEQITEKDSGRTKVTSRTIQRDLANLQKIGILTREGGRKDGRWVIVE